VEREDPRNVKKSRERKKAVEKRSYKGRWCYLQVLRIGKAKEEKDEKIEKPESLRKRKGTPKKFMCGE